MGAFDIVNLLLKLVFLCGVIIFRRHKVAVLRRVVSELLTAEQLEMYRVYLETSGNKPLIFGGGSPDVSAKG